MLEHPAIDKNPKQICTIYLLQKKGIWTNGGLDDVRTLPQTIKFSMLSFVLFPRVPLKYLVSNFEVTSLGSLVKQLFDVLLYLLSSVVDFFPCLLEMYSLIDPPYHTVFF